jgi:hypothetical protein
MLHAPHVDDEFAKNDRSMTMAAETEQMLNPRNSALSARAQITDGSGGRYSMMRVEDFLS